MSQHNDNRTNLKAAYTPATRSQISNRQLLSNFVKFMAWVIVIGLLLSPFAYQRSILLDNSLSFKQTDKAEVVTDD